jgi:MscS family membrane protein
MDSLTITQWMTLGALLAAAAAVGWVVALATTAVFRRLVRKTRTQLDDLILARLRGPLVLIWGALAFRPLVEFVGLSSSVEDVVTLAVRVVSVASLTWMLVRATRVMEQEFPSSPLATGRPELKSLVPLVGRITRIALVTIGAIAIVAQFGYEVTTLVAGLGIGGIALALAAQKTLEHVFGSVAIGVDQPIRVGDWVKVDGAEGEIEQIGLRSTRIRTMERSLVVIPNGRLADMQMENLGVRDRILLRTQLGIEYGSSVAQIRGIRDQIEAYLTGHPLIWNGRIIVRFKGFGASSLDIEVIAWVETKDMNLFRAAREEIFLHFMEIVEGAGCAFAFPTQTVHFKR